MYFVTGIFKGETFIGITDEAQQFILDLHKAAEMVGEMMNIPKTLLECIQLEDKFIEICINLRNWVQKQNNSSRYLYKIEDVTLLAPIPRPSKNVLCVGKNYKDHVLEMGSVDDIPEHIMIFTKAPTSVIGDQENILLHADLTNQLDYEGELAVIIGKQGKSIKADNAMDYVFGYTILNDITARDLQAKHKQFFLGKSLDASCPMGPFIVHKSVITDPHKLTISTKVNGEIRQKANTGLMIYQIPEIIATLSKGMTLEPGDIIATGTPAGVGKGFLPPRFLKKGDVVEVEVEQIGRLVNSVE
ncbi:fumarylacetoacetate hydrolase family protein [Sutcliffiella deserti]|uniref:fumarylacetoacetate hydrolase family protein n=1 Tax=Sutcliffiella deserti TaxID=2875501 RepID=UPI001CBDAA92|nr:fumarylacetoacetate hydrolase family protein [Sutcliffiella deserti]